MTLSALLASLREPFERTTPGGAVLVSECVWLDRVGNDVWMVRRDTNAGVFVGSAIVCYRLVRTGKVWSVSSLETEGQFGAVTCPLRLLALAPVRDREWRDLVWRWHEKQMGGGT